MSGYPEQTAGNGEAFLAKPFTPRQLLAKVEEVLGRVPPRPAGSS